MFGVGPLLIKVMRRFDGKEKVKLEDVLLLNERNGNYFTILVVSILSMMPTPFPVPFVSMFFGAVLIVLSSQMLFGKKTELYIPKRILNITFKKNMLEVVINKVLPKINRFEIYVRRNGGVCNLDNSGILIIIHLCLLLLSIMVVIPIPLISAIPSISIMIMCFGLINKNKLFLVSGIFLTLISIIIMIMFYLFGKTIVIYFSKL